MVGVVEIVLNWNICYVIGVDYQVWFIGGVVVMKCCIILGCGERIVLVVVDGIVIIGGIGIRNILFIC